MKLVEFHLALDPNRSVWINPKLVAYILYDVCDECTNIFFQGSPDTYCQVAEELYDVKILLEG